MDAPVGFCDGSAQSRCNRHVDNLCLLANHNHYKGHVEGGQLVEQGTHSALLAKDGLYAEMWARQASEQDGGDGGDLEAEAAE